MGEQTRRFNPSPRTAAGVQFSGRASGHLYGLSLDHFSQYLEVGDALLSVSGNPGVGEGLHLYQLSAEHLPTDYQVQILESASVQLHALKFESAGFLAHPGWGPPGGGLFRCRDSTAVS